MEKHQRTSTKLKTASFKRSKIATPIARMTKENKRRLKLLKQGMKKGTSLLTLQKLKGLSGNTIASYIFGYCLYHKFSAQNNTDLLFYSSLVPKSEMTLTGLKARYQPGCIPFWRLQGSTGFLALSSFCRVPTFLCGPLPSPLPVMDVFSFHISLTSSFPFLFHA